MARDALDAAQDDIDAAEKAGEIDHRRAPMLEALQAYHATDVAEFCIPAHKSGRGVDPDTLAVLGREPFLGDAPMHVGLDDRVSARQVLTHAQSLASDAYGADVTLFSTNGSTLSVELAVLAAVHPGEQIAVARNVHKSVVSGLVLAGAVPVWVDPAIDDEHEMAHAVTPESVEATLTAHPGVRALLVVSPTYFGAAADLGALADLCHERGIPLLVDDAWGALFPFHPELPDASLAAGADLTITSFHKTLAGIMQGSVISVKGDRIDVDRLQLVADSLETSSTSALLLAAMDGARRHMMLHGKEAITTILRLARRARDELGAIDGLTTFGLELVGRPGVAAFDETKVTIDVRGIGVNGFDAADWLYAERRIASELADHRHVMFLISTGDDDERIDRLVAGVRDMVEANRRPEPLRPMPYARDLLAGAEYPALPRDAFLGATRMVPLPDAVGEVAAEPVSPYPPGVPVLIPGQRITQPIVDFLAAGVQERMLIEGVVDPKLEKVRVVA